MSSLPAPAAPAAPYFDAHAFSVGLNEFLDTSNEIINGFNDHAEMRAVAQQISSRLMGGHDLPITHPSHPFNLYGDLEKTYNANLRTLCTQIMSDFIQDLHTRCYVISFFHSSGVNRPSLEELFDSFIDWVEDTTVPPSQDDEEDDDDQTQEAEADEESQDDETQDDETQDDEEDDDESVASFFPPDSIHGPGPDSTPHGPGPDSTPPSPPLAPLAAIPISPPYPMPDFAPLLIHSSLVSQTDIYGLH